MKKNILKHTMLLSTALLLGTACTDNFENYNTDPFGLEDNQVALADLFNEAQLSVFYNQSNGNWEYQLIQNLNADLYSGYMAIPSAFNGGINNDNYFMMTGWNNYTLNYMLLHVVKPMVTVQKIDNLSNDYSAISSFLKVAGAHKMVDTYGPVPYTQSMQGGTSVLYDDEKTTYTSFLTELGEACDKMTRWLDEHNGQDDKTRLSWDKMAGQSQTTWLQFGNTLRLRLAMRIAMADPALAKQHAEAAVANKYGLLKTADVEVKDGNTRNPQALISRDYTDCSISANFETILSGYNDPRLAALCLPVGWNGKDIITADGQLAGLVGQVKGIRNGLAVDGDSYKAFSIQYTPLSGGPWSTDVPMPVMGRAEASFLQAEGALRGWNMGGKTAEQYYEEGIRASFNAVAAAHPDAMAGADVEAYIKGTTTQADYVDPHQPANNIKAVNKVPVKFMTSGSKEEQLEQIITQKWIAGFPEGLNAWAEFRRTGYPHLFPIPSGNNNVQTEFLGGNKDDLTLMGIRRLPFTEDERNSNPEGYQSGVSILSARGQKDVIDARLWWDTGKNF